MAVLDSMAIRLECLKVAASNPVPHKAGWTAGVLERAQLFEKWVRTGLEPPS